MLDEEGALATQNVALFAINLLGIYRYLIRKNPRTTAPDRTSCIITQIID